MKFVCTKCKKEYDINENIWQCACGAPLDLDYKKEIRITKRQLKERGISLWKYFEFFPLRDKNSIITLGESMTPIIKYNSTFPETYLKLDYMLPTLSFKDRGAMVLISKLKELGIREIIEDSSGNAGASIAAYATRAKMKCTIFVPAYASGGKVAQIKIYGAKLRRIEGTRDDVAKETQKQAKKVYYASHYWNPFFIEGIKSFSIEVCEQMKWIVPDNVIIPIGSGSFFIGAYKGFKETYELGWIDKIPKLIGVQTETIYPIYASFKGINFEYTGKRTVAEGVAIIDPVRKEDIIKVIREVKGDIVIVSEEDIKNALRELVKKGIFVEPTSAITVAAFNNLIDDGLIDKKDKTIIPLTGSGFKTYNKILDILHLNF